MRGLFSFHRLQETVPAVAAEPACVRVFGKPHESSFADEVVFGDEPELAGIVSVDRIVGYHPIIIAGISHMIKSAVEFIKALSKYDNTYFITKGAENVLEERDFNEIIETHSHYRFKKLFEFLNVKNYKNIRYDKYITLNNDYANAIYNSMLPYNLTHKWSDAEVSVFPNIEYCEFNNLQDELEFINFYILNYINENGLKNIAIVIDQDLSYRFESILKLWKIPYNNTYGYKFLSHNLIKYMFLVIDVYNSNYKKDLFLSLLKNNFSYFSFNNMFCCNFYFSRLAFCPS